MKPLLKQPLSTLCFSLIFILSACNQPSKLSNKSQDHFFNTLESLCGQRFEGIMTFPTEGQDSFAGKQLVAQFEKCSSEQVRIPFSVGEDTSRTWIITKHDNSLELKHDHRHEDGTPHEVNLYGGQTKNNGSELSQSFFADAHTAQQIPEAVSNVWTISFNADKTELRYHLERHQKARFTAVLTLVK